MKTQVKFFIIAAIFTLTSISNSFSQLGVSYYASNFSKAGISYNFGERLWTELRVYTNFDMEDITPELVLNYNFVKKESFDFYVGIGGFVNFFNGVVLPIGFHLRPVKEMPNFALLFEIQPSYDDALDGLFLGNVGFRYTFNKKAKD
jgi:hypothetical protein